LSVIIILVPLFFTRSYGAFLGLLGGLFYLLWMSVYDKIQPNRKKKYLIAILMILFFGLILGYSKIDQIENSNERSSFHSRLMIWDASIEMIKESPFAGIGPGTFQEKYLSLAENRSEPYLEWAVPQPHNIFLAFYLESGLLGLIGFMTILYWFFKNKGEMTILKALMIYFLVHGLIDTTYWKNDLAIMFWIVLGLSVVGLKNLTDRKES